MTNTTPQKELARRFRILRATNVLLASARKLENLDNNHLASQAILRMAELAQKQAYSDYLSLPPTRLEQKRLASPPPTPLE